MTVALLANEISAADAGSKAAVLENYLAVSTWILNGSWIECHKKKHQPFSLSCVRFGTAGGTGGVHFPS